MADQRTLTTHIERDVAAALSAWSRDHETRHGHTPTREDAAVWGEHAITAAIAAHDKARLAAGHPMLAPHAADQLIAHIHSRLFGHGPLDTLLADPTIENIVANGHNHVTITRAGGLREPGPPLADSDHELEQLIRRIAATSGTTERRFDDAQPHVDVRLPDGSRLHAIKTVTRNVSVSIRKHRHLTITLDELVDLGTLTRDLAHMLAAAISGPLPCSMVIAGGTDTGKTTFARGLISNIPTDERLIVIEDNAELGLSHDPARRPHVVEMEVRQPNIEGVGGIGMDTLGRQALRMRPDRLIVGECRSGHEVRTMLDALNSGHEGSLTTIHADSSLSAITKLQTYALTGADGLSMEASAHLLSLVLHLVIHLRKLPDGRRVVTSVREITGAHGATLQSNEIWSPGPDGTAQPAAAGHSRRLTDRLSAAGWKPGPRGAVA
jgi:Flp pilus assembly CpaF family ATPase